MKLITSVVLAAYSSLVSSQQIGIRGSIQDIAPAVTTPSASTVSSPCKSIIAIGATQDPATTKISISFDSNTDEQFVCLLQDGSDVPLTGTDEQLTQLRLMLNNGTLISGESAVDVEPEQGGDATLAAHERDDGIQMMRTRAHTTFDHDVSPYSSIPTRLSLPPGPIRIHNMPSSTNNRRLASYKGPKPVLAVKVIDKNGLQHPDSAKTISDKIFGTYGDSSTMTSQFAACSYDQMQIVPFAGKNKKLLADVGVLEIQIPISIQTASQGSIRKEVKKAVEAKLGMGLPGGIEHVMVILEGCYVECGWSAYAFVNSWLSVYKGNNYKYPAVQLHEIGHNLNMAHSGGMDGRVYTDHTCVMGNPLFSDDVGKMCYNAAKNYQFANAGAWYNNKPEHRITWDSGKRSGTSWSGRLIGVAEYDNNPDNYAIVVRVITGSDRDLFIGFNRASGMNADVKDAGDLVTLIEAGNGNNYAQSFLKAILREGDEHVIDNWRKSKENLTIIVKKIDTSVAPGYAEVLIEFGPRPPPTNPPTRFPSSAPSLSPSSSPSSAPVAAPSRVVSQAPTATDSSFAPTFISSSQNPTGSPVSSNSTVIQVNATAITMTPSYIPTSHPTSSPTTPPSKPPTLLPTASPTPRPTKNPMPSSPEVIEYLLDNRDSKGSAKGIKFTIRARRDVVITGFDVFPRKNRSCQMRVYTQTGDYRYAKKKKRNNIEEDTVEGVEEGWATVFDSMMKLEPDRLAGIRVEQGDEVFIPQWEVQSFIIYCNRGMLVAPGKQRDEGVTFSENEDIEVREGVKSKKAFSKYTGYAQLMGKVRYYVK